MKRVLLSIGCNQYTMASSLSGAEKDATSIAASLVGVSEHQYDAQYSKTIYSPTAEEFRKTLTQALYDTPELTVFTLYFAGHASVEDDTLFLCFADTNPDRIQATAVAFPDILRIAASAKPRQINFVLDACQSNGLGFDLQAILKRTVLGGAASVGISFVASAAADEFALETKDGGRFTLAFNKIIRGETLIQRERPFLNLSEIAQKLQMGGVLPQQTVSYWTLNLQGPNLFSKNPHYFGPTDITHQIALQMSTNEFSADASSEEFKSAISSIPYGINERELARTLDLAFSKAPENQRVNFIYGLSESFRTEFTNAQDSFLESRLYTLLLGQLLNSEKTDLKILAAKQIIIWLSDANRRALSSLLEDINTNPNALLPSLFSDFYDLPIRISDIFGQCSLFLLGQSAPSDEDIQLVKSVLEKMLTVYGNSVLCVSDEQAVGYLLILEVCRRNEWTGIAEEIVGRLYNDLLNTYGRSGRYDLSAAQRLELITSRYQEPPIESNRDLFSQPSDLVSVILSFAALLFLDEAVDYSLILIDHTSINYFIPNDLGEFATQDLEGTNYTMRLGHDFWRCIDLRRMLDDILPRFNLGILDPSDLICSYAAALSLRDRIPWHLVSTSKT